jgi:pimeloyl-ACP methyl ester carboxylesterase
MRRNSARCTFADVSLTALPDSGHFVPIEAPEQFAAAIRAALGGA